MARLQRKIFMVNKRTLCDQPAHAVRDIAMLLYERSRPWRRWNETAAPSLSAVQFASRCLPMSGTRRVL